MNIFALQCGFAELFHWRRIISEYEEFDMFLADIFSPFLIDQRKSIAPSSMQSIGSAIAVMAIISIFFLPDKTVVLVNVIGLSHALIWLPQLISALDPCERIPIRSRHPRSE
uniref:Uncharacterized protein n=1 Tax=Parascaris equorum TaxID=6256 RepID=A0A914RXL6_PAREQ